MQPPICDIQSQWQQICHIKMLYKGSKRQQIWHSVKPNMNQHMYDWGIRSLSIWWAENLNLKERASGRGASAVQFLCFYSFKDDNYWWKYLGLVWVNLGNLTQNLVWPLYGVSKNSHFWHKYFVLARKYSWISMKIFSEMSTAHKLEIF